MSETTSRLLQLFRHPDPVAGGTSPTIDGQLMPHIGFRFLTFNPGYDNANPYLDAVFSGVDMPLSNTSYPCIPTPTTMRSTSTFISAVNTNFPLTNSADNGGRKGSGLPVDGPPFPAYSGLMGSASRSMFNDAHYINNVQQTSQSSYSVSLLFGANEAVIVGNIAPIPTSLYGLFFFFAHVDIRKEPPYVNIPNELTFAGCNVIDGLTFLALGYGGQVTISCPRYP